MADSKVRFGVIGYGLFGAHHANAIVKTDRGQLAAIAVKSEKSQAAARDAHESADVYGDYQELLARPDIDIVSVVVPNHLHYEIGKRVLESGKHLLLEKPMALAVEHCDELNRLAFSRGRVLAVGHELRLSSLWGGVKSLIDDGAIGRPQYALIELSRFPYRTGSEGWRYDLARVGNWILEEPIHFFDLARWYMSNCGDPQSIYARANSRHAGAPELNDNFTAVVNFGDGAYAVVSQTLAAFGHHVMAKVTGTNGTIWARWSAADARSDESSFSLQYGLGDEIVDVPFAQSTGELVELEQQIAAVAEAVRNNSAPPCTGIDGRWSTQLCLAAQQSVDTGQLVSID